MKRAIAWFAHNHVAANLLMMILVVGGLSALGSIHQKSFPDVNVEMVQINVIYLAPSPRGSIRCCNPTNWN